LPGQGRIAIPYGLSPTWIGGPAVLEAGAFIVAADRPLSAVGRAFADLVTAHQP
jgi:hypothetical protein